MTVSPEEGVARFLARLGITPFTPDENELHARLWDALRHSGNETHAERLVITHGVLTGSIADLLHGAGTAKAKLKRIMRDRTKAELAKGKSAAAAKAEAEYEAREYEYTVLEAETVIDALKQTLSTVSMDWEKTRTDRADARQGNHVGSYGGGLQ